MDISNIYSKKTKVLKYWLKLVDLEINKGINDEYLRVLHGSDVELHVGGSDQQELEQQGLSNLVSVRVYHDAIAIMLSLECMMNWEPSGKHVCC